MFELLFAATLIFNGPCEITHNDEVVDYATAIYYDEEHHKFIAEVENLKGDILYTTYDKTYKVVTPNETIVLH